MKTIVKNLAFLSFFILANFMARGQGAVDSVKMKKKVIVTMKDGDELRGHIHSKTDSIIVLSTKNGVINIITSNVKSIYFDTYEGIYRFPNSHDTRYFFGPTAIPTQKNKGYYQNILVVGNFVNYGITKNISLAGGFEFLSLIYGDPTWFFMPKIGFKLKKNVHLAGGAFVVGGRTGGTASLGYGALTLGTSEHNLTFGGGYGTSSRDHVNYSAFMLSGTVRASNNISLLTENYIIAQKSGALYVGIFGIRILSPKNAFDIGLLTTSQSNSYFPVLPYIQYARAF